MTKNEIMNKYWRSNGLHCPFCDSGNLHCFRVIIGEGEVHQKISCQDCSKEWTDFFDSKQKGVMSIA